MKRVVILFSVNMDDFLWQMILARLDGPSRAVYPSLSQGKHHLSHEKTPPTFLYTGWLIGILIMVYYNPYKTGIYPEQPRFFFMTHLAKGQQTHSNWSFFPPTVKFHSAGHTVPPLTKTLRKTEQQQQQQQQQTLSLPEGIQGML